MQSLPISLDRSRNARVIMRPLDHFGGRDYILILGLFFIAALSELVYTVKLK